MSNFFLDGKERTAKSLGRGDAVSMAEQFRRALDQHPSLFPEQEAYESYRRYCSIVMTPPMDFERWKEKQKELFGVGLE